MKTAFSMSIVIAVLIGASSVRGQSWNQWRGAQRDGSLDATMAPTEWPQEYRIAWQTEIGEGYSSPVSDGRIAYVHSRIDPDEIVTAIDLQSGNVIWKQAYPANFNKNQYAKDMAKGPNSTPLVADGRLFTVGVTGIVTAWDANSGRQLWRKDFSNIVDTSKLFCGTSASPLIVDGRLIIQVGSDLHGGQVLALDPEDGKEIWKWTGPGPGYASAIDIKVGESRQIVTLTESSIVGLAASSGRELWSIPFPDEWQENIVTPLWTGSLLVISGTRQGTHAYRLENVGDQWKATQVWENRKIAMYMSSPVLADGTIFGHSARQKGQFVALNAADGETRWTSLGRSGDHASVILTPRYVIWLTNEGRFVVVDRNAKEYQPFKQYQLEAKQTWSMPVMLGNDLLVRDEQRLVRLSPVPQ